MRHQPDRLTWAGPSQKNKEKIGGFGWMQKTALVKHPILHLFTSIYECDPCAERLML
jgi:hypothetical protein